MKILVLGDVVGQAGCECVREYLPKYKRENGIDMVVANGENSAQGNGITPYSADFLFDSGVDVITTGNHALRRREIFEVFEQEKGLIRPANFHPDAPGVGVYLYETPRTKAAVVNVQGVVYMENLENPFDTMDRILNKIDAPVILVDFHAEATAEKLAMGFYLDGRVSCMYGTHTHVQTADERFLPQGTAYITDIGMCGAFQSVLGVKKELAIKRLRTHLPVRFENETEGCCLNGIVLTIDEKTGKVNEISRVILPKNN